MDYKECLKQIKKFVRGDVCASEEVLNEYSRDTSLFKIRPEFVIFPKDMKDIKNLVNFAVEERKKGHNISLTARSAGTDMTGGPLSDSIVLGFTKYFNHIKKIGRDYAITEPGVFYREFEKKTLKHNLLLPCYTASRELCAIGGMIANNSGGEKTLAYGKMENYVEELKVILSDGNEYSFSALTLSKLKEKKKLKTFEGGLYKKVFKLIDNNYDLLQRAKPQVAKNSAGYYLWNVYDKEKGIFDLTKLIVGSQGTLGIVTEAKLKLIKPRKSSRLLVIMLKDMAPLAQVINKVLEYKPDSFESYDDHTFKVAIKLFPFILKRLSGNMFRLAFDLLPEFLMFLTGGVPKMVLIAEFSADTDKEALAKAAEAQESLENFGLKTKVTKTEREAKKFWTFRRESFNLLRQHMKKLRTAPFIEDISVKPEVLPEFLPKLNNLLSRYDIIYTVAGHVGDGNFHIIPLMDFSNPESVNIIKNLSKEVYKLVIKYKGSITGEHNDGLIRTPYLKMMYGKEVCNIFEEIKDIFDPNGIFNPKKKVRGSLDYAMDHIDKKR
ncbi:MAG: FAD-binding oxidoreductase [Parcubacteria group bacterium]|nr:FAD-binding oxidoreductase [Parcubacteria group bacterium]MCR4343019.1 FAD-binding oxidoreductase [Patescibacteria group bacterium]